VREDSVAFISFKPPVALFCTMLNNALFEIFEFGSGSKSREVNVRDKCLL